MFNFIKLYKSLNFKKQSNVKVILFNVYRVDKNKINVKDIMLLSNMELMFLLVINKMVVHGLLWFVEV